PPPAEIATIAAPADVSPVDTETQIPAAIAVQSVTAASPAFTISWYVVLASVYWIVAVSLLVLLTVQRWSLRRLARMSTDVHEADWIRLLNVCAATLRVSRPVRLLRSRERNV